MCKDARRAHERGRETSIDVPVAVAVASAPCVVVGRRSSVARGGISLFPEGGCPPVLSREG